MLCRANSGVDGPGKTSIGVSSRVDMLSLVGELLEQMGMPMDVDRAPVVEIGLLDRPALVLELVVTFGVGIELDRRESFSSLLRYLFYILGPTITLVLLFIGALLIERRVLRA